MKISTIHCWAIALLFALAVSGYGAISFLVEFLGFDSTRVVTVPYRGLVLVLSLFVIITHLNRRNGFYLGSGIWLLLGFWFLYICRIVYDIEIDYAILRLSGVEYYLFSLGLCFVPMLAFFAYEDEQALKLAFELVFWLSVIVCWMALLKAQVALESNLHRFAANEALSSISTGHQGATLAILSAWAILHQEGRPLGMRAFFFGSFFTGLLVVGFAGSRSPAAALFFVLPFLVWPSVSKKNNLRLLLFLGLSMMIAPFLVETLMEWGSVLFRRVETTIVTQGEGETRVYYWREAWRIFLDNPIFGSTFEPHYGIYPHNLVIESFMATGFFGGLMLLAAILLGLICSFRLVRIEPNHSWIALLFIQALTLAMFSRALYNNGFFWCMLAAVFSTMALSDRRRRAVRRWNAMTRTTCVHRHQTTYGGST